MKELQINQSREFLMQRMGDMSQLAGVRRYELIDGKAKGIEAVDCRTGSGFDFTVLPGRGMDIAWAAYKGVPIGYISKTGMVSPVYYESDGVNWLRNFFAGLLTTCGLSNVGWPCTEEDPMLGTQQHGLHGRISNMAADNVCVKEAWQGDEFVMTMSGRLRESMLHGENLTLQREITTTLGASHLTIRDVVENEGFTERPLMILYHINVGYPVLDDGSRLLSNSKEVQPASEAAKEELDRYHVMGPPVNGAPERVYFHDLRADADGQVAVALVNDQLDVGAYVRYNQNQLPKFTQWKCLRPSEYVLGIEPGNCWPIGRTEQRKKGALETLRPGEKRTFELEIGVLRDQGEIKAFERVIRSGMQSAV